MVGMVGMEKSLTACFLVVLVATTEAGLKLTNIQCMAFNESLGDFKTCSLKAVKRDVIELNVYFELLVKPVNNATFMLRLKKRGDRSQNALVQYKIDICEFLRRDRRKPVAELFYSLFDIRRVSNINHSCPIDHDIIINRCRVNTMFLNMLAIAPGEYTIQTNWFVYANPIAEANISIKLD